MKDNTQNQDVYNKWVEKLVHDYWLHMKKQMKKDGVSFDEYTEAQQKRIICDCFLDPDFFRKRMTEGRGRTALTDFRFDFIMDNYGTFIRKAIVLEMEKQKALIELENMDNESEK